MTDMERRGFVGAVERFFRLSEHGTTLRTEVLGGATTFATMAYIIVVNPAILQFAGLPVGPSTVATILVAVFGSLLMGLYANRPLAVAPYMGENAFIAFGLAALGDRLAAAARGGVRQRPGLPAHHAAGRPHLAGRRHLAQHEAQLRRRHRPVPGLHRAVPDRHRHQLRGGDARPAKTEFLARPDVPVKIGNFRDTKVLLAVVGFLRHRRAAVPAGQGGDPARHRRDGGRGLPGRASGQAPAGVVALPFTGDYDLEPDRLPARHRRASSV